jgi:hypothetical protein
LQLWTTRIGLASQLRVALDLLRLCSLKALQALLCDPHMLRLDLGLDDAGNLVRFFGADFCARHGAQEGAYSRLAVRGGC